MIGKKEFAAAALDPEDEVFVIHIAALRVNLGDKVHPSKRAQIAYLKTDKASNKVSSEYADFVDVFFLKLATELPKKMGINDYTIKLIND